MSDIKETILAVRDESDQYYAAFGRFIDRFSTVEQRLHSLLWELSGTRIEVARVAFGDARYDKIVTAINRLYDSRGEKEHPSYRRAVDQMGHINRMRNDIVHLGAYLVDRDGVLEGLVSNKVKAMPGREKEFSVDIDLFGRMGTDLTTIMACFTVVLLDHLGPPTEDMRELFWRDTSQRPWLYKPPPQPDAAKQSRKHRPER